MRTFNQKETNQLLEAEMLLKEQGLSNDDRNLEILLDYFDKNPTVAVTAQTVLWVANHPNIRPSLTWLTPAQKAWADLRLSAAEFTTVQEWLSKQQILVSTGDEAVVNALAVVTWCQKRGYAINAVNLQHAVGNIMAGSQVRLHLVQVRAQQTSMLHNYAKDPMVETKQDPKYRPDGRVNHSYSEPPSESTVRGRAESEAKTKAEAVRGKTHAASDTLQKILVTNKHGEIDWQATYEARVRAANPNPGIVLTR